MTFARPDLIGLAPFIVLVILGAIVAFWRRSVRLSEAYGGPDAARRLTGRRLERFPAVRLGALLVGSLALLLAASGVQPDEVEPPPPPTPVDLMLAVDVSHSMTAEDVGTKRIERARELVGRILDAEVADRVALTLFADWPYELVPLTHDDGVVSFFAPWVAPELVALRDQGTALEAVVTQGVSTWRARERSGVTPLLLVVTDGEVHGSSESVLTAVSDVAGEGIAVWTAGIGTPSGAPLFVPGSDGAPLLDERGDQAMAGYDEALLRAIADRSEGSFHDVSDPDGVRGLLDDLQRVRGETDSPVEATLDPTLYLILLGLGLLALDTVLDRGARPEREP